MDKIVQIYVRLLKEDLEVWRPVEAVKMGKDTYNIISPNPEPKVEKWEFGKGDVVRCRQKLFSDKNRGMIAIRKMS